MFLGGAFQEATAQAAATGNPAFAALIWWLVPFFAVLGAIIYVIWVSKFKDKYANETNRSVDKFSLHKIKPEKTNKAIGIL